MNGHFAEGDIRLANAHRESCSPAVAVRDRQVTVTEAVTARLQSALEEKKKKKLKERRLMEKKTLILCCYGHLGLANFARFYKVKYVLTT